MFTLITENLVAVYVYLLSQINWLNLQVKKTKPNPDVKKKMKTPSK